MEAESKVSVSVEEQIAAVLRGEQFNYVTREEALRCTLMIAQSAIAERALPLVWNSGSGGQEAWIAWIDYMAQGVTREQAIERFVDGWRQTIAANAEAGITPDQMVDARYPDTAGKLAEANRRLAERDAEIADLRQTSGDLCSVCSWRGVRGYGCEFCALVEAKREIADAIAVLSPSMPESGLVDACRQAKQAAISWHDNAEKQEVLIAEMRAVTGPKCPQCGHWLKAEHRLLPHGATIERAHVGMVHECNRCGERCRITAGEWATFFSADDLLRDYPAIAALAGDAP